MITIPIEKPFQGYLDAAVQKCSPTMAVDVTEENLQSRTRGAILMALANKLGGLLLTTGNKSEYAVGYATIYGDMCGGYAPIKDLYKTEVFALSKWRNTVGGAPAGSSGGVIPPAVISRPPTAELRENQKDEDSLPPYDVLDAILLRHIDQEQSRDEIVRAGFDAATVDRVLKLVRISVNGSATRPRRGRRSRGVPSVASGAIRSPTATSPDSCGDETVRWHTADFDALSWHDVHVHGFRIVENGDGTAELQLDIDFILEWLSLESGHGLFRFRIAQAMLQFHEVFGLRFALDYVACSAGMSAFAIEGITRVPLREAEDDAG